MRRFLSGVPGAPRLWGVDSIRPRFTLLYTTGRLRERRPVLTRQIAEITAPTGFLKIAKMQDITINLYHMMDFGNRRFTARIANTGEIIHTMDEFVLVAADCLRGDFA